jgi:hypothetical protein
VISLSRPHEHVPVLSLSAHRLSRLKRRIDTASEVTPSLIGDILIAARRTAERGEPSLIKSFSRDGAWTDAALALISCTLPGWRLRRICVEDRLWWCALDRGYPVSWAEAEVDECHENMTLALLKALITAMQHELDARVLAS